VASSEFHDYTLQALSLTMKDSIASIILKHLLAGIMLLINKETRGGKMMNRLLVVSVLRILSDLSGTSREAWSRAWTHSSLQNLVLMFLLRS
jgi:hypothetical protein